MSLYQPFFDALQTTMQKLKFVSEQHPDVRTLMQQVLLLQAEIQTNHRGQEIILTQVNALLNQLD